MATEPLSSYLKNRKDIDFVFHSTACWRGYLGTWEIRDRKLFLIDFKGWLKGHNEVDLSYLFPEKNEVFADWFNEKIRIPHGKMLKYVHLGYESVFEKDLILNFKKGVLINEEIQDNTS
ncbi:MAG: hypothetical protein CMD23_01175 [Flavobacteriales bacterium]|nr:hypothetical protein [Flavobacteriales bacterium]